MITVLYVLVGFIIFIIGCSLLLITTLKKIIDLAIQLYSRNSPVDK